MWLVVIKQIYYPSVYECDTEQQARSLYNDLALENAEVFDDLRIYICEIKGQCGYLKAKEVKWD